MELAIWKHSWTKMHRMPFPPAYDVPFRLLEL